MARRKGNLLSTNSYDSNVLYTAIIAIIFSIFIVRIKVFVNFLNFDQSPMKSTVTNFFTYYKLRYLLVVFALLLIAFLYKVAKYKYKPNLNFILLGTVLICIAAIVATLMSPLMYEVNLWGIYSRTNGLVAYLFLFVMLYILSNLSVQNKHLSFLVHSLNIVSILLAIIAVFQFFGIDILNSLWYKRIYTPAQYYNVMDKIKVTEISFRGTRYFAAASILGQYNYYGAFCSVIYPLLTAFALNEEKTVKKTLLIVGSIMVFAATILAQSMGSIIAIFAVLLIIPIFLVNKSNYKKFLIMAAGYIASATIINILTEGKAFHELFDMLGKVFGSILVIPAILAIAAYALFFIYRNRISKYRYLLVTIAIILILVIVALGFIYILNNVVENNMGMLTNRGYIWYFARDLIKDNFVIGYGPDSFFYNFTQINPFKHEFMPKSFVDKPHNMYLQVLFDIGIFGLIGFMILLVGMLLKLNKRIDIENDLYKNTYFRAVMLVIAAYMIQGIVNDNHLTIQPILYLIIGIAAAMIKPLPRPNKEESK